MVVDLPRWTYLGQKQSGARQYILFYSALAEAIKQ
jgi:hypothetical protein